MEVARRLPRLTHGDHIRALVKWREENIKRNDLVVSAYLDGLSIRRIMTLTGIADTTLKRIIRENTVKTEGGIRVRIRENTAE